MSVYSTIAAPTLLTKSPTVITTLSTTIPSQSSTIFGEKFEVGHVSTHNITEPYTKGTSTPSLSATPASIIFGIPSSPLASGLSVGLPSVAAIILGIVLGMLWRAHRKRKPQRNGVENGLYSSGFNDAFTASKSPSDHGSIFKGQFLASKEYKITVPKKAKKSSCKLKELGGYKGQVVVSRDVPKRSRTGIIRYSVAPAEPEEMDSIKRLFQQT